MRQSILLAALSAVSVVVAETNFTINVGAIDPSDKTRWCNGQFNTCGILCGGDPTANSCDTNTLKYTCTCSNGTGPGLQYYTQTMPTFICQQAFSDCNQANVGNSQKQSECKKNIQDQCGTLDPTKVVISNPSTSSSSSAASGTASSTSTAPSSSSSRAAAAHTNAAYIGNGVAVVAAGVLAALL